MGGEPVRARSDRPLLLHRVSRIVPRRIHRGGQFFDQRETFGADDCDAAQALAERGQSGQDKGLIFDSNDGDWRSRISLWVSGFLNDMFLRISSYPPGQARLGGE